MVTASAVAFAGAAGATVTITSAGFDTTGSRQGTISYSNANLTETVNIGRFKLSGVDNSTGKAVSYLSYCIDPFEGLGKGTFTLTPLSSYVAPTKPTAAKLTATKQTQLATLIANAESLSTNADRVAAVQLAVWEIVYEDYGLYNYYPFDWGTFEASGANIATAKGYAATYIGNITSGLWKTDASYSFSVLASNGLQDQLVWSQSTAPVPEPATWAMFIGGFGLVGGAMRRTRTKIAFA